MSGPVPDRFTPARLAAFLHVPERFVHHMTAAGMIETPDMDGCWTEPRLRAMLHAHPWLRMLHIPLCARELYRVNAAWEPPVTGPLVAGRRYRPLWRIIEDRWERRDTPPQGSTDGPGGRLEPLC